MKYIDEINKHFLHKNGHYFREGNPEYTSPEIDFLLKAEIEDKLDATEKHLKIIKYCALVFVASNLVSLIMGIVALTKMIEFFN